MQVRRKYTLLELNVTEVDNELKADLSLGNIHYEYGLYRNSPEYIFDTEDEAIKQAFERNKYGAYIIVPLISFED